MLINRAPILMIQWGAANELNELESIEDRFAELSVPILHGAVYREVVANEAFRESVVRRAMGYEGDELQDWTRAEESVRHRFESHDIASVRLTQPSPTVFQNQLTALISMWANPQTLYISCHGTPTTLAFDRAGGSRLPFHELGKALSCLSSDCVTLVLGACHALDPTSSLLQHIPDQVSRVYGFVGTPAAMDVASLMLSILHQDAQLFSDLSNESSTLTRGGVSWETFERILKSLEVTFEQRIDDEQDHPARHVRGLGGVGIRALRRVEYDDGRTSWQGPTIWLHDDAA
jgi:hypothetical protein